MLVRMYETKDGSPNGSEVKTYAKGEEHDLPEDLAQVFIREKWAKKPKKKSGKTVQADNK